MSLEVEIEILYDVDLYLAVLRTVNIGIENCRNKYKYKMVVSLGVSLSMHRAQA